MKRNKMILSLLCALAGLSQVSAQEKTGEIGETRTALQKWVETRQMTSKLRADWAAEKELLGESIKMFEKESKNLDELIAKVGKGNDKAREERAEQEKLNAEYKAALDKIKSLLGGLEQKTLALAKTFPPPLAEKLNAFIKRLGEDPATTKYSSGERVQAIVAVLAEADKFNGAISVTSELRKNEAGTEVQVRVIYLGLATGYYTDKEGKLAGVGTPSPDGWKWSNEPALAPAVTQVVAMYENAQPPAFVALPAKIQ